MSTLLVYALLLLVLIPAPAAWVHLVHPHHRGGHR